MAQVAEGVLSLSGWAALAWLFVLPALEAPAFLGLVLPGELALLLGGVLAQQDRVPLAAALAVVSAAPWPATRPATGSAGGGARLVASRLGRRVGPVRLRRVESLLAGRRPGPAGGPLHRRGQGRAPRAGRHARAALPDLRPLDRGGRHRLGRGPRPRRLRRRGRLAPRPPPRRPGRHRPGRRRRGRPGRRLRGAPVGPTGALPVGIQTVGRPTPCRHRQVEVAQALELGREPARPRLGATGSAAPSRTRARSRWPARSPATAAGAGRPSSRSGRDRTGSGGASRWRHWPPRGSKRYWPRSRWPELASRSTASTRKSATWSSMK